MSSIFQFGCSGFSIHLASSLKYLGINGTRFSNVYISAISFGTSKMLEKKIYLVTYESTYHFRKKNIPYTSVIAVMEYHSEAGEIQ